MEAIAQMAAFIGILIKRIATADSIVIGIQNIIIRANVRAAYLLRNRIICFICSIKQGGVIR